MLNSLRHWILIVVLLVSLPMTGILLTGQNIHTYLEFPPMTRHVVHAPFNWWAFAIIAALNLLMLLGLGILLILGRKSMVKSRPQAIHAFPAWGWFGGAIMLVGWFFAWTRVSWFAPLQHHTFCFPWVGYILLVNAWCRQRSGTSLLHETPGRFLLLFPMSALFWWYFEFLNRIVENWHYTGVEGFNPLAYTLFASLAFSTVLPAVLSTLRLLLTLPLFSQGLAATFRLQLSRAPFWAALVLIASAFSLVLLCRYPDYLYPLVWSAPLLVVTSWQTLTQKPTIFAALSRGDWRAIVASAVAALICGFFWELWNFFSMARWEYSIPFVNRFHVFAMPVLGYGGYLPFGLECLMAGSLVIGHQKLSIRPMG